MRFTGLWNPSVFLGIKIVNNSTFKVCSRDLNYILPSAQKSQNGAEYIVEDIKKFIEKFVNDTAIKNKLWINLVSIQHRSRLKNIRTKFKRSNTSWEQKQHKRSRSLQTSIYYSIFLWTQFFHAAFPSTVAGSTLGRANLFCKYKSIVFESHFLYPYHIKLNSYSIALS